MTGIIKTKKRKIIKRKPGAKNVSQYFTNETQESIVLYQKETDEQVKEKIYVKEILPAFDALVENLINVYGFKVMHDSKEDLKLECLEFLYTAVNKFDAEKGSKAFSYFNVVAKNWLTIKSKQCKRKTQQYISLDDKDNISSGDLEKIEHYNIVPSYDDIVSKEELSLFLKKIIVELGKKAKTPNEKITIDAIEEIINNLEELEFLSKRAVLLYIRQITNLSSKQLSIVLSSLKKYYKDIRKQEEFLL